ncbi:MAG: glycosyltransferase [Planctomycetota bacterium]|nr:MAG: glycosyltransferase [Planctomycetota bacterium]
MHTLVAAFSALAERFSDVWLLVVGDLEPHRGQLDARTLQTLSTHPRIRRVPFTDQIERCYAAMDLLTLPTRREGLPYVLLEAAALGVPVVATRVTGCVDAVVDGETGLLVPPDDPDALRAAIEGVLSNAGLAQRLGQAARERVERAFSADRLIEAHLALYAAVRGSGGQVG